MTTTSPETDKTVQPLTRDTMKPGGRYNWKNQPDRLVYLGRYGGWHQFRKIGDPRDVWCEVLDADLHMLEETRVAPQAAPAPEPSAQGEPVAGWEFVIEGDTAKVCSPREGPGFTVVHERYAG